MSVQREDRPTKGAGNVLPLHFYVEGDPAPQGSKSVGQHGNLYESSKRVGPWRLAIAYTAMSVMNKQRWKTAPAGVGVFVAVVFDVRRTDDLDKLCRSTLDGLGMGGVYEDDRQVVELHARRRKVDKGAKTGADIIVSIREE